MQKISKIYFFIVFLFLFTITLLQSKLFSSPFALSYYGYGIVGMTMVLSSGIARWQSAKIGIAMPLLLFVAYVCYMGVNTVFVLQENVNFGHIFLSINVLILLGFFALFQSQRIDLQAIAKIFSFLVIAEGILCIAQYLDWVATHNKLFEVCGSLPNPNYPAMFLAMSVPVLLFSYFTNKGFWRHITGFSFIALSIALLLLQCRAAVIGTLIGVFSFLFFHFYGYIFFQNKVKKLIRWQLYGLFCSILIVFTSISYFFYQYKQESSEGRLFVWKISAVLCKERPVLGYGTYTFKKYYNLAQANYFQNGNGAVKEIQNASHVQVPYNDYLLTFVEGGFIGFALFVAFILSLLRLYKNLNDNIEKRTAYVGVLVFSVMSFINSQYYVACLILPFIFYTAMLCYYSKKNIIQINSKILSILLIISSLYFFNNQFGMMKAELRLKTAEVMRHKNQYEKAIFNLEKAKEYLTWSDQFWLSYANLLFDKKESVKALEKYEEAEKLTSDPNLFLGMANCYIETKNYPEAIKKCSLAMNIVPNRMKPKFMLMNIFAAQKDSTNTLKLADEILLMKPKGVSKDAALYKEEAAKMKIFFKSNKE